MAAELGGQALTAARKQATDAGVSANKKGAKHATLAN